MNYRIILKNIGTVLILISASMIPSLIISLIYQEDLKAFLISIPVVFILGLALRLVKTKNSQIHIREGFAIVSLGWIFASVCGALPFMLSGIIPSFIDALFESISSFTTTGATILHDIESLPKGILFWKSFSLWMGGLGVLILMIALMPSVKVNSQFIMNVERSGLSPEKFVPKQRQTAKILYIIYIFLTILVFVFLLAGGMPLFDSLIHAFGTSATGGFSNMNSSIGAYNNVFIEVVISAFMILFGVNFLLYYYASKKDLKSLYKNEELRFYLCAIIFSIVIVTINIYGNIYNSIGESIRHASFQVASMITTTGYSTTDYNQWPILSQFILIILMFIGTCAGSTGGGIKCIRTLLLFKIIKRDIVKLIHPRAVYTVKLNKKIVNEEALSGVSSFFSLYILITVFAIILIALDGKDFISSVTSVISSINNIGAGFGIVGPSGNYADFSIFSKLVLSICMILGRLEIYPLMLFCMPSFWKKASM